MDLPILRKCLFSLPSHEITCRITETARGGTISMKYVVSEEYHITVTKKILPMWSQHGTWLMPSLELAPSLWRYSHVHFLRRSSLEDFTAKASSHEFKLITVLYLLLLKNATQPCLHRLKLTAPLAQQAPDDLYLQCYPSKQNFTESFRDVWKRSH